jgi:DNA-binding transcriptional LysR family regulator
MDFRHLKTFLAVVDELSFTKAARRLKTSQPFLSRQVQQLEQEIGVTLFVRRPRGVELTVKGRIVLEHARSLNEAAQAFLDAAKRAKADNAGIVRIGVPWGLWDAVNRIRAHHVSRFPAVDIRGDDLWTPWENIHPIDAFRLRRIDVALVRSSIVTSAFECEPLFDEQMTVLVREDHLLASRRLVRLADLTGEKLLEYDRQNMMGVSEKALALYAAAGIRPDIVYTHARPSEQAGLMLVASGAGVYISVKSQYTWSQRASGVVEVRLDEPDARIPVSLMWRKSEASPSVLNLVDSARQAFPKQLGRRRA